MRPAEATLYIGGATGRQANSRLISPDRAAQRSRVQLVEGFIDYVPGKYLAPVMSDHTLDVFLEDFGKHAGSIVSFGQPFRILPMPDQGVPANLHSVPYSEIHNLIGLGKVEALRLRMNHLPLKSVFRFHHVELARERGC